MKQKSQAALPLPATRRCATTERCRTSSGRSTASPSMVRLLSCSGCCADLGRLWNRGWLQLGCRPLVGARQPSRCARCVLVLCIPPPVGHTSCARPVQDIQLNARCCAAGLVNQPTTFTMDQLLQLPSVDVTCTLTCAGAPPLGIAAAAGCQLRVARMHAGVPCGRPYCRRRRCGVGRQDDRGTAHQAVPPGVQGMPTIHSSHAIHMQATGARRRTW